MDFYRFKYQANETNKLTRVFVQVALSEVILYLSKYWRFAKGRNQQLKTLVTLEVCEGEKSTIKDLGDFSGFVLLAWKSNLAQLYKVIQYSEEIIYLRSKVALRRLFLFTSKEHCYFPDKSQHLTN